MASGAVTPTPLIATAAEAVKDDVATAAAIGAPTVGVTPETTNVDGLPTTLALKVAEGQH